MARTGAGTYRLGRKRQTINNKHQVMSCLLASSPPPPRRRRRRRRLKPTTTRTMYTVCSARLDAHSHNSETTHPPPQLQQLQSNTIAACTSAAATHTTLSLHGQFDVEKRQTDRATEPGQPSPSSPPPRLSCFLFGLLSPLQSGLGSGLNTAYTEAFLPSCSPSSAIEIAVLPSSLGPTTPAPWFRASVSEWGAQGGRTGKETNGNTPHIHTLSYPQSPLVCEGGEEAGRWMQIDRFYILFLSLSLSLSPSL